MSCGVFIRVVSTLLANHIDNLATNFSYEASVMPQIAIQGVPHSHHGGDESGSFVTRGCLVPIRDLIVIMFEG